MKNSRQLTTREKEIEIKHKSYNRFFYFSKEILGYDRLTPQNEEWCWELEKKPKRLLHLAPRKTYKTTVGTKAYPMWRLEHEPNLRILIINETEYNAKKFLREIKGHYERNKKFRHFFGDRVSSDKWGEREITISTRTKNYSEASITAMGFGSTLTSAHYDIIIIDDPCGMDDRESTVKREKKKQWFREIPSICDQNAEIHVRGTRWHYDDLYADIEGNLNPELDSEGKDKYFVINQSALNEKGESNFPENFTKEDLKGIEIEVGVVLFAANYLNQPLAEGSQLIKLEDLQYYNQLKFEQEYLQTKKRIDFYGFIDPSLGRTGSDYVAIIIGAVPKDGYIRIPEAKLILVPPSEQVRLILELQQKYKFKKFGIEENLFRGLLKKEIEDLSAQEKTYIRLTPITQTKNKKVRIESAEPQIKRYVRFRDDWKSAYPKLINQLIHYPVGAHDDGPDALEGLLSMIKTETVQIYVI
jgi:predicted phage terminase large subunit-like protein